MKRRRLLFLLPSLLLASCWQRETSISSEPLPGVETAFSFSYHEDPYGQERLLGLWNMGKLDQTILDRLIGKDKKKLYFAGDTISVRSSEPFLTQETFPAKHILPEGAEIYSVSFSSSTIEEIPVSEFESLGEGKYAYRGNELLSSCVLLGRTREFVPLSSYSSEKVYASFAPNTSDKDAKTIAGLYAFDPRWVNDVDPVYFASLNGANTVLGERGKTDGEIFRPMSLRFFYRDDFASPEEFSFHYDPSVFDLFANPESDARWLSYTLIPKKRGTHPFSFSWRGVEQRYSIRVEENDLRAEAGFPYERYDEFRSALEQMDRHALVDPYPGLENCPFPNNARDEVSFSFDAYSPEYAPYLFDDCYFPRFFPDAPASPIMDRRISFAGKPSALRFFSIAVGEIDPGHTKPQDRVSSALFSCAPKESRYAHSVHPAYEAALVYGLFNPAPITIQGIEYRLLKAGPKLYAFFEDETYAYSLSISYAMDRF